MAHEFFDCTNFVNEKENLGMGLGLEVSPGKFSLADVERRIEL